ncbi:MAG: hypothetical protein ABI671_19190 [Burkholderiales bacterium]
MLVSISASLSRSPRTTRRRFRRVDQYRDMRGPDDPRDHTTKGTAPNRPSPVRAQNDQIAMQTLCGTHDGNSRVLRGLHAETTSHASSARSDGRAPHFLGRGTQTKPRAAAHVTRGNTSCRVQRQCRGPQYVMEKQYRGVGTSQAQRLFEGAAIHDGSIPPQKHAPKGTHSTRAELARHEPGLKFDLIFIARSLRRYRFAL